MNESSNHQSIIVFDGTRYKNLEIDQKFTNLKLYFALPNADTYIISFVSQSPSNKYTVVSDDIQLIRSIKRYTKKHYSTMELWNQLSFYNKKMITDDNYFYNSHSPSTKTTDFQDNDIDDLMEKIKKIYKKN